MRKVAFENVKFFTAGGPLFVESTKHTLAHIGRNGILYLTAAIIGYIKVVILDTMPS